MCLRWQTPGALSARVSNDRQDMELSVSAKLRALRNYAKANGYSVSRECRRGWSDWQGQDSCLQRLCLG